MGGSYDTSKASSNQTGSSSVETQDSNLEQNEGKATLFYCLFWVLTMKSLMSSPRRRSRS